MTLTQRERDCLTIISEENGIKLARLSQRLKVKPPTAFMLVKRLIGMEAIRRDRNGLIVLTRRGENEAKRIKFKHRVMETLLSKNGVKIEEACNECKKLDFLISYNVAMEIFKKMDKPSNCPHGKPIKALFAADVTKV
ncbi:MAG: metal-dependent transcriptional regulator [Candidatus Micrarchaeaceae archaeon]